MIWPIRVLLAIVAATSSSACGDESSQLFGGYLVIAPEVETFRPCGASEPLWLDYTPEIRKVLYARHEALRSKPYDETYAELRGTPGPPLDCGFCEEYSGSFKVAGVVEHRARVATDCAS